MNQTADSCHTRAPRGSPATPVCRLWRPRPQSSDRHRLNSDGASPASSTSHGPPSAGTVLHGGHNKTLPADVAASASAAPESDAPSGAAREDLIGRAIAHASHCLPAQGPIGVFLHHNTLHAFEEEPFEQAVLHAARLFGTEPFLSEARYRAELKRGRIRLADVEAVLDADLGGRGGALAAVPLVARVAFPQLTVWLGGRVALVARIPTRLELERHDDSQAMAVCENGRFVPFLPEMAEIPVVPGSADWFRGHRGHLPPARVTRESVAGSIRPRRKTGGRPTNSGSQGA